MSGATQSMSMVLFINTTPAPPTMRSPMRLLPPMVASTLLMRAGAVALSGSLRSTAAQAKSGVIPTPPVFGDPEGDVLVVGWGSTKGAIEEAVERLRDEGRKAAEAFFAAHRGDLGRRSTRDLDTVLEGV